MSNKDKILVYGATGFTGKLFVKAFLTKHVADHNLMLAGRTASKVEAVAKEFDCDFKVFDVKDASSQSFLESVLVVVNAAGPFHKTVAPMVEACLQYKCHYVDVAGEVPEYETVYSYAEKAISAGIQLFPGAGFGSVPTDLVGVAAVRKLLPTKTHLLKISFGMDGSASRGSLSSILPILEKPGHKCVNGELVEGKPAESTMKFSVGTRDFEAVYNPVRADLFTARFSTNVPNIETYSVYPFFIVWMMKGYLLWLRDFMVKYLLGFLPEGPSDEEMKNGATFMSATATSEDSKSSATVALRGPEAYMFTAECLCAVVDQIVARKTKPGFVTAASYGNDLIKDIKGVEWDP